MYPVEVKLSVDTLATLKLTAGRDLIVLILGCVESLCSTNVVLQATPFEEGVCMCGLRDYVILFTLQEWK